MHDTHSDIFDLSNVQNLHGAKLLGDYAVGFGLYLKCNLIGFDQCDHVSFLYCLANPGRPFNDCSL